MSHPTSIPCNCQRNLDFAHTSRLDLNNALLYGVPDCLLKKIKRIHYASAQLLTRCNPNQSMSPILHKLHWLPIGQRIEYKILLMVFKCLNKLAPDYLSELINKKENLRPLRSSSDIVLTIPKVKTSVTYGDRAFSVAAPKLWNNLPSSIKQSSTIDKFKSSLKTHLFKVAFQHL